ncbi:MAG: hypothetical protein A2Z99_19835 [Treponema sp. GWB1_62_6]|nr:MAG: hypothetical protein A2001_10055 [Treponema sp. GWC1_61_84]OHE71169.1 MAG: hypothetical protein A2Z99_19835 [Treponema sp. GWB1_62_6]
MYVLGIDVGTSGTKALVVGGGGRILARGYQAYPLKTPGPGRVEQDPKLWWKAVVHAVREACAGLDAGRIGALSLSTQGASSLLVNGAGNPLTDAITWMDTRAGESALSLAGQLGDEAVYRTTGWPVDASLDAAKLHWLVRNEGALVARSSKFVSTLEYINHKLVGRHLIDPTNAAMRQLMSLRTLAWDGSLVAFTGADPALLPDIVPTGEFIGTLGSSAAEELGLGSGVRVFNGAHDQYCACLGSDTLRPGELMLSTGTAWVLMAVASAPIFSASRLSPGPHIVDGLWGIMASLSAAGSAFDWFRSNFTGEGYAGLEEGLGRSRDRLKDLFFYPMLNGAQFPSVNPKARAAFIGLGFEHGKYELAEAVMEGVVFQMRAAMDEYRKNGFAITRLRLTGGAVRSPYWARMIASNVACEVQALSEPDSACIGAAAIAGVGLGLFPDHGSAVRDMNPGLPVVPWEGGLRDAYAEKFDRYTEGLPALLSFYGGVPPYTS